MPALRCLDVICVRHVHAVRDSKTAEARLGAPGEIREEPLADLPEDCLFVGTAADWDLEAIRRYNAEQNTVYRLNENDCRCAVICRRKRTHQSTEATCEDSWGGGFVQHGAPRAVLCAGIT